MHKNHMIGCAAAIVAAVVLVSLTRGSAGSVGFLVAALICPLTMVVMMRLLMGPGATKRETPSDAVGERVSK